MTSVEHDFSERAFVRPLRLSDIADPGDIPEPETDDWTGDFHRGRMGLMTPEQVAAMLKVKAKTLEVWRSRNRGPAYVKLGREIFYSEKLIKEWIEANVVQTVRTGDVD